MALGYMFPNGNSIGGPVIGRGTCIAEGLTVLDPKTGQGLPAANWTYGAHGVEIEVDTESGEIEVLNLVSAFDLGRVINEGLARGQVVGGALQGLGTALIESFHYDDEGHLMNNSFTDYKIPTAKDLPLSMEPVFIETPQLNGPYGARGVAEHPMISVPSAVGNAIADGLGVEINELPLTPERVYLALKRKGNRG
jgi:CO/xanthine dehydrogenase Mo-binding subunit